MKGIYKKSPRPHNGSKNELLIIDDAFEMDSTPYRLPQMMKAVSGVRRSRQNEFLPKTRIIATSSPRSSPNLHHVSREHSPDHVSCHHRLSPSPRVETAPREWRSLAFNQAMIRPSPPPRLVAADPSDPFYKSLLKSRTMHSELTRPEMDPTPTPASPWSRQQTKSVFNPHRISSEHNEGRNLTEEEERRHKSHKVCAHHLLARENYSTGISWDVMDSHAPYNSPTVDYYQQLSDMGWRLQHYRSRDNTFSLPTRTLQANKTTQSVSNKKIGPFSREFKVHCMAPHNWLKRMWGFQYKQGGECEEQPGVQGSYPSQSLRTSSDDHHHQHAHRYAPSYVTRAWPIYPYQQHVDKTTAA